MRTAPRHLMSIERGGAKARSYIRHNLQSCQKLQYSLVTCSNSHSVPENAPPNMPWSFDAYTSPYVPRGLPPDVMNGFRLCKQASLPETPNSTWYACYCYYLATLDQLLRDCPTLT